MRSGRGQLQCHRALGSHVGVTGKVFDLICWATGQGSIQLRSCCCSSEVVAQPREVGVVKSLAVFEGRSRCGEREEARMTPVSLA